MSYRFIRLGWTSSDKMSDELNTALEQMEGREKLFNPTYKVVNMAALSDEVVILVEVTQA